MIWRCPCGAEVEAPERPGQWCPVCLAVNLWSPAYRRPITESLAAAAARPWTAREVCRTRWAIRTERTTGIGWAPPCLMLVAGPPGSGKSTLAAQIASGSAPVVFLAAEHGAGPILARMLVLAGMADRSDVVIVRQAGAADLATRVRDGGCIVIDSVTMTSLQAADLRALADAGAEMVIAITQVTKDGSFAGRNTLLHEADVAVYVERGQWHLVKSRFGPVGSEGSVRGVVNEAAEEANP